jgi:hypothetical protein
VDDENIKYLPGIQIAVERLKRFTPTPCESVVPSLSFWRKITKMLGFGYQKPLAATVASPLPAASRRMPRVAMDSRIAMIIMPNSSQTSRINVSSQPNKLTP